MFTTAHRKVFYPTHFSKNEKNEFEGKRGERERTERREGRICGKNRERKRGDKRIRGEDCSMGEKCEIQYYMELNSRL